MYKNVVGFAAKKKTFEFCTRTPKLSNQDAVFIKYDVLIGCLFELSMSTNLVLESFVMVTLGHQSINQAIFIVKTSKMQI
jgi:hypothetical protein